MIAFYEQMRDKAFDRQQMKALRGGDSAAPLDGPDNDGDPDGGGG